MKKTEILKQAMTFATLNELYNGYCTKLLEEFPSSEIDLTLTIISKDEFESIIDFLHANCDKDEYYDEEMCEYCDEEVYDMRYHRTERVYYMTNLQLNESEYKDIEKEDFQVDSIDKDTYNLTNYKSVNLMPICFEQFYEYCEEVLYKKEKELNEKIEKEFPKDEETTMRNEEIVTKNKTNYRKIAENFLKNYEFVTKSYESLSKVVNDEQLIDVFEMIFKNFDE